MRGGTPSTMAPTPEQCDSPNVETLNNVPNELDIIYTPRKAKLDIDPNFLLKLKAIAK
jgi:hypothetical protein